MKIKEASQVPTTIKEGVIEMIQQLPPDTTLTDIMAELYFRQKIEAGLDELDEGKGVSHEQARTELNQWLS